LLQQRKESSDEGTNNLSENFTQRRKDAKKTFTLGVFAPLREAFMLISDNSFVDPRMSKEMLNQAIAQFETISCRGNGRYLAISTQFADFA